MSKEIRLRIVLQSPIDGIIYGLQRGKGPHYETVQPQPGKGQDLTFDFSIIIKETVGSLPTVGGPFVQGPPGSRFIYIGIGSYAGQPRAFCNGRIKVPLPEAAFPNMLSDEVNPSLYCTVLGRTEDGKPVYATVKPFGGWLVNKESD